MIDKNDVVAHVEPGVLLLRYIFLCNLLVLSVFVCVSWYLYGWEMARSVFAGGILACSSFFLLKRDVEQMIGRVSRAGQAFNAVKTVEKVRFFLKFYARIIVFGLLLFVLVTKVNINMIGLAVGLSTIIISVIVVFLSKGRTIYSVQCFKGA
jgi:hypothetical protein